MDASPPPEAVLDVPPDTLAAPSAAERDSALAVLQAMRRTAFDSAFVRLHDYRFTRQQRTEHRNPDGTVAATQTRTIRYAPGAAPTVLQSDSTGVFPQPVLSTLGPASTLEPMPPNVASDAFPEDAAYLSPRSYEHFRYWRRASTVEGRPVFVVTVRPRPTPGGAEQSIRYARLVLTRATRQLVAATTIRVAQVLLFEEQSHLKVRLRRAPEGRAWVPVRTHFRVHVDLPFRAPRSLQTVSTYEAYALP
jgi:hypothetical protein